MSPSLVQHAGNATTFTSGSSGTASATFGSSPTAGNCLIACFTVIDQPGTASITSVKTGASADNWASAAVENQASVNGVITAIYACPDTGASSSTVNVAVTFGGTASTSNNVVVLVDIFEVSGLVLSSAVDKTSVNSPGGTGETSFTSDATATTTQASEFWIGVAGAWTESSGVSVGFGGPSSPWANETALTGTAKLSGTSYGAAQVAGYQVASSTGTATYSGTMSQSSLYCAAVVTLKAAAAASPATAPQSAKGRPAALRGTSRGLPGSPYVYVPPPVPSLFTPPRKPARGRPAAGRGRAAGAKGAPYVYVPPALFAQPGKPAKGQPAARRGSSRGSTGAPWTAVPVSVVNQWAATFAQPSSFEPTPPALQSTVVALDSSTNVGSGTGTPTAGNWLVCICGWNQSGLTPVTQGDADDVHSFWRPGNVWTSDWAVSPSAANTRTSIWYTPNLVRVPADVYAAPSGVMAGMACTVLEIAGLGPWDTVTGISTAYAAAATSLGLSLAAPAAASFILAAVTGDSSAAGQSFAPAGWTVLVTTTASDGSDHTCDAVLQAACLPSTSGSVSVSASASSAADLSGVIIAFEIDAPSPVPAGANPNWPGRFIAEAAFGAGYETPPDQCTWTVLTDNTWPDTWQGTFEQFKRAWGWQDTSGIPWGLGQYQTSSGAVTLDNWDGSLSPSNVGGLYYSNALNSNMSFQSGVAPWTATGSATLAQSSAQVYASAAQGLPQYSLQVTPNGSTAGPGAVSEQDAVSASSPYSASAWFYSTAGYSTGAQVAITWYTSAHASISTVTSTATAIPAATWTQVELLDQTSPSNAAYAAITVKFSGTPTAVPFWVAEAALASGAAAVQTGQVTAGTPIRLRMALGTIGGTTYNRWYVWQRNTQSWPEQRNQYLHGFTAATLSDPWQSASGSCPTPYRGEVEQDGPYAWWPCDDQPRSANVLPTALLNAAAGNSHTLNVVLSPHGGVLQDAYTTAGTDCTAGDGLVPPGMAIYTVGADSGWNYGDPRSSPASAQSGNPVTAQPGSASWQVSGQLGETGSYGWFLSCNDSGFPVLADGITVEIWFNYPFYATSTGWDAIGNNPTPVAAQPYNTPLTIWELATGSNPVCILQLDTSGHLNLITYAGATGTSHSIYTASDLRSNSWHSVAVTLTETTWQVWLDGGTGADVSGTAAGMTSGWTWLIAAGDFGSNGGSSAGTGLVHGGNVSLAQLAVYPAILPAWRILAHYVAAVTAFGQLPAPSGVAPAFNSIAYTDSGGGGQSGIYAPDGSSGWAYGAYSAPDGVGVSAVVAATAPGGITSGPSAWAPGIGVFYNNLHPSDSDMFLWVGWTGLAPSFAVYTAQNLGSEAEAAIANGSGVSFNSGYGSGASGAGVCRTAGGSGASPPTSASAIGDTVAQRIERVFGYGGITVPMRAIDPASNLVQAAIDVGGQQAGANVQSMINSDNGWAFYDNVGVFNYRDRPHLNSDSVTWYIGMNTAAGQIPFAGDIKADNDPQRVYTAITVAPYSPDGASLPDLVPSDYQAVNAAQAQYGPRPLALTNYLQSSTEQQNAANFLFTFYGTLRKRIAVITIDAATHPAAWGIACGLNISDIIQVYDAPIAAPATTTQYRVSQINRSLSFGAAGQPPQAQVVIVADPIVALWE